MGGVDKFDGFLFCLGGLLVDIASVVCTVRGGSTHFGKSPEQLGPEQVRQYLLHLINDKQDTWNTIQVYRGALKFLYVRVLKQSWFDQEIAVPKRRLPHVMPRHAVKLAVHLGR